MQTPSYLIHGVIVAGSLACSSVAYAEDAAESPWGGKIAIGAIATDGNSKSSSFNSEFGLSYAKGIWHNEFAISAIHARAETTDDAGVTSEETTTERYTGLLRSALDFSDSDYLFAQLDYEKDLFGGVRERSTESLGYGRRLINSDRHKLDVEAGLGARQILAQQDGAARESEMIGRGAIKYAWQLTDTSRFSQKVSVESGDANTFTESVSQLKLSVIGGVFANLGFTWKNNSQVPAGTENADTISSVSVSYEFGA